MQKKSNYVFSQLDKKSANISKQINSLQKKLDKSNKLKNKIETLKDNLAKVRRAKELELAEISLMCKTFAKAPHSDTQVQGLQVKNETSAIQ